MRFRAHLSFFPKSGFPPATSRRRWGQLLVAVGACLALFGVTGAAAQGETVRVAVASNFTEPAQALAARFGESTEHRAKLSFGSTGQLFAQITQGAPFDVFLAADQVRPARAAAEGWAEAETLVTYAVGRLALFSREPGLTLGPDTLKTSAQGRLAIANPVTAPYGAAALEVLEVLGLEESITPRLVQGTNIAQTFQFVSTGNAALGFVALSQARQAAQGSLWEVPADMHQPIAQDAVLLTNTRSQAAAGAFLALLTSAEGQSLILKFGYDVPKAEDRGKGQKADEGPIKP